MDVVWQLEELTQVLLGVFKVWSVIEDMRQPLRMVFLLYLCIWSDFVQVFLVFHFFRVSGVWR